MVPVQKISVGVCKCGLTLPNASSYCIGPRPMPVEGGEDKSLKKLKEGVFVWDSKT
jgi:hypothetical protein